MIGHSFIQRYRNHLERSHNHIGSGSAADFAPSFNLGGTRIYVTGLGGLKVNTAGRQFIKDTCAALCPRTVVLEVGTNDLVNGVDGHTLAQTVISLIRELISDYSVVNVVVCQIVGRYNTRSTPQQDFDRERALYNYYMQREARRYAKLYVYKHESSIVCRLDPRISADRIHVTHPRGMRLYHFSIRKAIVNGLKEFKKLC